MDAKLVVVAGDAKAAEVKLRLPAILGRGREASLTVPHPLISRQHCEIFEKDGFLVVRDLGSLNGTFIGEERVSEAVLPDGELLTIGTVTFRAIYGDDPNLQAPAREDQPVAHSAESAVDDRETERAKTPASSPAGKVAATDVPDDEFTDFLASAEIESGPEDEEAAEVDFEAAPALGSPNFVEDVEEVEVVDPMVEPAGADEAEAVEFAEPAGTPTPAAAAATPPPPRAGVERASDPQSAPTDNEDEDVEAFLRDLDI